MTPPHGLSGLGLCGESGGARDPWHAAWLTKLRSFRVMGLEPSPELLAIVAVNFVRGILGLSALASEYFYKDDLGVSLWNLQAGPARGSTGMVEANEPTKGSLLSPLYR